MFLRKTVLSSLLLCCFVVFSFAQKQALQKIDKADLIKNLTFIASDDLQGRKLGTQVDGLGITADYLAENAKGIGLLPGAKNYFQEFEMVSAKPAESNLLEINNGKGKVIYSSSNMIVLSGIADKKELDKSSVVLGGFGDQLANEKIEGEVIIIAQGNAEDFQKENNTRLNYGFEMDKVKKLSEAKPEMILLVTAPSDKENKGFNRLLNYFGRERYSVESEEEPEAEVPVLIVQPDMADKLLGGKGKYEKYLKATAANNTSGWKMLKNRKLSLNVEVLKNKLDAKNVIGIVEGSDPKLKDEYVVFMAHYDHLGIGKDGDVYNGADDNGSGTVAIMEVAEAFASLPVKPKRSILFLWVTCEEIGHIGSTYYCDNPIYPLEKTVAAINLDMVGRVHEERDSVWDHSPKKVKDFDGLYTLSNDVWPELAAINDAKCKELGIVPDTSLPKQRFLRASDHYHFHKNGVPILNYATGYHADYHKVGDEVEKIDFDKVKRVADLCFLLGYEVANLEKIEFEGLEK